MQELKFKDLSVLYQNLLNQAAASREFSYSPYSNFKVGAALLTFDEKIITGANMESVSFGATICAERAALARANSQGERKFKALAIIAQGDSYSKEVVTPCGICRQMLAESAQIAEEDMEIIMSDSNKDKIILAKISELLPLFFNVKNKKL